MPKIDIAKAVVRRDERGMRFLHKSGEPYSPGF
jgi:hypothetical protein